MPCAFCRADGSALSEQTISSSAALPTFRNVTAVSCGLNHTAAVTNGAVYAVGLNRDGQCSYAALNAALMSVPDGQPRTGAACYLAVACGYSHTVALRGDGRVFAIGASPDGRCDTAAWHDVVDIACGVRHTAAVLSDGHCVATGDNSRGQCAVGDWENVVMIACGEFHTAGVTADGRVLVAGNAGGAKRAAWRICAMSSRLPACRRQRSASTPTVI